MERGGSLRFSVRRFLTPYVVRPTHVNRTEGEGNEKRKERPNLRLLLSPTPSLSLPIPFSSHYAPQAGAAKRRYATGIGDERRRDPAWSDVSGSLHTSFLSHISFISYVLKVKEMMCEGSHMTNIL